jgi:hypothetical protein
MAGAPYHVRHQIWAHCRHPSEEAHWGRLCDQAAKSYPHSLRRVNRQQKQRCFFNTNVEKWMTSYPQTLQLLPRVQDCAGASDEGSLQEQELAWRKTPCLVAHGAYADRRRELVT